MKMAIAGQTRYVRWLNELDVFNIFCAAGVDRKRS
jgi:hypothetical protein